MVAKAANEVIGFLVARLIMITIDNQNFNSFCNESEVEIYNLAVEKQFRRMGVGRNLLNEIFKCKEPRWIGKIWLEVRESNQEAIKFYMANGFTIIYQRKNFYHSPTEDALVLKF